MAATHRIVLFLPDGSQQVHDTSDHGFTNTGVLTFTDAGTQKLYTTNLQFVIERN